MSSNTTRGYRGYAYLKKISGSGAVVNGTEILIPYTSLDMVSPNNDSYPPTVHQANSPSQVIRGKYTPAISLDTQAKASWFTPAFLNSLLVTRDSNFDTDLWAVKAVEPSADTLLFDGVRFGSLIIAHNAAGGPLSVSMQGIASDPAGTTVFSGTGSTDAGELFDASAIDYGAAPTADVARAWKLTLACPQNYDFYSNRSRNPSGVSTGQISGTFELEQSAAAATIPSSTVTIRVYDSTPTLKLTITLKLNLDIKRQPRNVGFGNVVRSYTLIDTAAGGAPVTFA